MKKYLIIFKHAPFDNYSNVEGLEFALSLAAFDQSVSLMFLEAGVLQLIRDKTTDNIQQKDATKVLAGLDLFEIEQLYAHRTALDKYSLHANNLNCDPKILNDEQVNDVIAQHDIVLTI